MRPATRRALAYNPPVAFLLRDTFHTSLAAGSVNGTLAEPGPGTRTANDTTPTLAISSGALQASARVAQSNPGLKLGAMARVAGRALLVHLIIPASGAYHAGWTTGAWSWINPGIGWMSSGGITAYASASYGIASGISGATWAASVLRATGSLTLVQNIPGLWTLMPMHVGATDPVEPRAGAFSTAPSGTVSWLDEMRVADLPYPFTDPDSLATVILAGARSPGDTFTHEATANLYFDVTALPTAGQIEFHFHVQDANNYWQVTVDAAGDLDLDEVVAGVPTQRGTYAAAIAANDRILITLRASGTTIVVHENVNTSNGLLQRINYNASTFLTETGGELASLGTGGAVSDIQSWPFTLPALAVDTIERYTK